jgi:hypothetical protein
VAVVVVVAVAVVAFDTAVRGHGMSSSQTCTDSYATCFKNREPLHLVQNQKLDDKQFSDMLGTIHDDLEGGWRTPVDPGRSAYDTPFWNANPSRGDGPYQDQTVCLGDKCSQRSAINYVGEGMYSARTGQSLEAAKNLADVWNFVISWGDHMASDDELYWLEYGYNAYMEIEKSEETEQ